MIAGKNFSYSCGNVHSGIHFNFKFLPQRYRCCRVDRERDFKVFLNIVINTSRVSLDEGPATMTDQSKVPPPIVTVARSDNPNNKKHGDTSTITANSSTYNISYP